MSSLQQSTAHCDNDNEWCCVSRLCNPSTVRAASCNACYGQMQQQHIILTGSAYCHVFSHAHLTQLYFAAAPSPPPCAQQCAYHICIAKRAGHAQWDRPICIAASQAGRPTISLYGCIARVQQPVNELYALRMPHQWHWHSMLFSFPGWPANIWERADVIISIISIISIIYVFLTLGSCGLSALSAHGTGVARHAVQGVHYGCTTVARRFFVAAHVAAHEGQILTSLELPCRQCAKDCGVWFSLQIA